MINPAPVPHEAAPDIRGFGHEVARLRRARGMTLEALAEATGVSRQTIINVENGHKTPRLDTAWRLARALDLPLSRLVEALG